MAATSPSIETQIVEAMRNGIIRYLNANSSQTTISVAKLIDANWVNWPFYEVVPGAVRPDGRGRGAQQGGSLIRIQQMSVYVFTKLNLDQYSFSEGQLTNPAIGELELFEKLRQLFSYTFLGDEDGTNCLLSEPMWFESEGATQFESQDTGLVSRQFTWSVQYSIPQPDANGVTLFLPSVQVPLGP